jgi:predicted metal-dependent phosphoesterase TrpH
MIVEMHCHTSEYSSCSRVAAMDLARRAWEVGIQTIVLTDHHHQWNKDELAELRKRTRLPDVFQILAGQEVEVTGFGHMLIYGAEATIAKVGMPLRQIRHENPDAAIIWAHPYRDGRIPPPEKLLDPLIDGIEIFNSNYTIIEATRALQDWHRHRFTAVAGTDTHGLSYVGAYPTLFDHLFTSIGAMAAEIKAGRCRPYFKEIPLKGVMNTRVTEVTMGREEAEIARKVIVKTFDTAEAWSAAERSNFIAEELLTQGFDRGPYRVVKPIDEDLRSLSLIEECVPGKTLFDTLMRAEPGKAPHYLEMAAQWLARLHNARLKITPADEYLQTEPERLEFYLKSLIQTGNKHLNRVREIRGLVLEKEKELIQSRPESLVQGHGDFHPKNVFIGRDDPAEQEYVTATDLGCSYQLPRAFDVGTFLAQYVSMFFNEREVQRNAPRDVFLQAYLQHTEDMEEDFMAQMRLFKARTCLSILCHLANIKLGDSDVFWRVLLEAERSLAYVAAKRLGSPA